MQDARTKAAAQAAVVPPGDAAPGAFDAVAGRLAVWLGESAARVWRDRSFRAVFTGLLIVSVVSVPRAAIPAPARATPPPDPAAVARLSRSLAGTTAVRVVVGPRAYVLLEPRVTPAGLEFGGVENFPPRRPAVFVGGPWDTVPPPPHPVPWSQVSSVDRRVMSRRPAIVSGAAIGALLFGGIFYGFAQLASTDAERHHGLALGLTAGAAGAVVGGLLAAPFKIPEWVGEYPDSSRSPHRERGPSR